MTLTVKLRSPTRPPSPTADTSKSNAAERMRKKRAKLKEDPSAYAAFCAKEAARQRQYRKNLTAEKRKQLNEKSILRMKKLRESKHDRNMSSTPAPSLTTPRTRLSDQKRGRRRELWREQKRRYRLRMSAQKKRRVRERDVAHKREVKLKKEEKAKMLRLNAERRAEEKAVKANAKDMENVLNCVKSTLSSSRQCRRKSFIWDLNTYLDLKYGLRKKIRKYLGISERIILKYSKMRRLGLNVQKRKKRSDATSSDTQASVHSFLKRVETSTCIPNRKSVRKDGQPRYVLQNSMEFTRKTFCEEHGIKIGKSAFAKMRPRNILLQHKARLEQCLCEVCTNIDLKLQSLNRERKQKGLKQIPSRYDLSDMTLCTTPSEERLKCIDRKCSKCGVQEIDNALAPLLQVSSEKSITWKKWCSIEYAPGKKRVVLTDKCGNLHELVEEIKTELASYPNHLFQAKWQQKQFTTASTCPPPSSVVTVMDFAENYTCSIQREVQSAHWYQAQVTIHPVVTYYRCQNNECDNNTPVREAVNFLTEDNKHDHHAVNHFVCALADHLHQRAPDATRLIMFSDGCAAQYKSRTPLVDISFGSTDLPFASVERHYFGSRHGKNPCDGEGGVVKNYVTRAVRANSAAVTDAQTFFDFCKERLTKGPTENGVCAHSRRTFVLCKVGDICRERSSRVDVKTVPGIRGIHAVAGVEPYVVNTRRLSCFCKNCTDSNEDACLNAGIVDTWVQKKINRISTGVNTDEPLSAQRIQVDVTIRGNDMEITTRPMADDPQNVPAADDSQNDVMTPRPAADDTQNDVMTTRPTGDDTQNAPAADDTQNDVMTTRPAADDTQNDVMTTRPAADDTQNDVMTTRPTGDDTQNDVEITADRPVADVHQAADEYQCGDFVLINISVGKRGKILEYVGEVKDVVGEDLVIKYMAKSESHPGLFIWPAREDVSRECRKQIVKKMPNPVLREDISSTRLQFFTFAELSPES